MLWNRTTGIPKPPLKPPTSTILPNRSLHHHHHHHHHHHQLYHKFMSCFGLKKQQLLPPAKKAKRAWKDFTSTLQSKIRKLKRSIPIKHVVAHLNVVRRRPSQSSNYHFRRKKLRLKKLHHHRTFAPVYVDELFQQPEPEVIEHVEPPLAGAKVAEKSAKADQFGISAGAAASSSSSSSSSSGTSCSLVVGELGEVDVRAEMFIAKFREEMRLQRQRSFEQYQEMLARGV